MISEKKFLCYILTDISIILFIFILEENDDCEDTDDGALDYFDSSCADWYNDYPEDCGSLDDEDFTAGKMCCACRGECTINSTNTKTKICL